MKHNDLENQLIVMTDELAALAQRPMTPQALAEVAERANAVARVAMG